MDMGAFLDASWRVALGQQPYADFMYFSGPLHLYMNAVFFHLFGFGTTAILMSMITVHSAVILFVFFMMRRAVPFWINAGVTVLTTASFYWSVSHPWHDQSAFFWGMIGLFFLIRYFPFADEEEKGKNSFSVALICGLSGVLSFLVKSNIGAGWIGIFSIIFITNRHRVRSLAGYTLGLVIGILLGWMLIRYPALYWQQTVVHLQAEGKGRLLQLL